jgi:5-methylcytosine-specific restriction protein A
MGRIACVKPRVQQMARPAVRPVTVQEVARPSDAKWQAVRRVVLARDKGLCVHCAASGHVSLARDVDHRIPLWQGGAALDPANLQSLCRPCHKAKTAAEASARASGSR